MAAKRSVSISLDPYLGKALVAIVEKLPRKVNTNANPPVELTGVLRQAVESVFYDIMLKREHPLALNDNAECTDSEPCNECRKDVFRCHAQAAVIAKHIEVVSRGKYEVFLMPGEDGQKYHAKNRELAEQIYNSLTV